MNNHLSIGKNIRKEKFIENYSWKMKLMDKPYQIRHDR